MASKHRQVGAQNFRLEETNRSMYITIVSVMVSKKLCLFERSEDFFRKLSNFMASEIVLKVGQRSPISHIFLILGILNVTQVRNPPYHKNSIFSEFSPVRPIFNNNLVQIGKNRT